jgi:hypothetical protein
MNYYHDDPDDPKVVIKEEKGKYVETLIKLAKRIYLNNDERNNMISISIN